MEPPHNCSLDVTSTTVEIGRVALANALYAQEMPDVARGPRVVAVDAADGHRTLAGNQTAVETDPLVVTARSLLPSVTHPARDDVRRSAVAAIFAFIENQC